ncbi:microtubule-associated protein 10 [Lates japonicus]|uniref:Microtubule-associated protein 10 n=1 Tax=Lates japonicus TaxID=270547 RepID=A0AAD3R5W6_LATJO|nr:microtubule-associated protein 10 [Lates japonicus]
MSEGHNSDNLETLFSFELLVEYIRIERDTNVSDELALGVRLLDFPTLLIYQPERTTGGINQPGKHEEDKRGQFAFHRGKSCFFKMNLNSLHTHLSNTPLYAMVLDVKEEIPKLVGSSLISLAKVMDRIRQDVTEHGVSAPSSHGERGLVGMCSLTGEKIGSISLSYKLLSLGASLLPHITDKRDIKSTRLHGGQHREKIESSGSSRQSSRKSSFSDSSREGNEEADYDDDFNSLEPSDAYSPDPMSSPEPSRAKTPKSPVRPDLCTSDSGSESVQRRAHLPVPVKAPISPQRTLRGTHIIRPRTHTSALSFSSDDGDRDRSASLQTICSRKQMMTESSRVERSSGAESFISSRGHRSESTRNSGPVQGFSQESVSSFEPQEAEELEDELGSLDFGKEYQHISELVANKLPGYTM